MKSLRRMPLVSRVWENYKHGLTGRGWKRAGATVSEARQSLTL